MSDTGEETDINRLIYNILPGKVFWQAATNPVQGCRAAAAQVLELADLTADPCEDFYQFACGKISSRTIPADKVDIYPASRHESPEYVSCLVKGGTMD